MVELRLPEVFEEWTRTLGYQVTRDGDVLVLANTGGELRYYFVPDPAGVALLRAERAEDPAPVMTAAKIDDLVRFLITVLGYDLRAIRNLPTIRLPFDWSSPAPGFSPVALQAGWTGLRTDESRVVDVAMVDRDVVHPIVSFSYVASAPVAQLIASYEDRDGAPLLSEFVPRLDENADSATVSAAIVEYLGWGRSPIPAADHPAVAELARVRGADANALLTEVQRAIDATNAIDLGETRLQTAGPEFKARLSAARPDLNGAAVDALASRWFFERLWLGEGSGPAPRFFALSAARDGQPVPRALFRRRIEAGHAIDEVLRDVDTWRPDTRGRVQHAIDRYLDSDLEEISPARAAEFERMVAVRSYRPFTTP